MPRYFFDLADHETSADQSGTELPDGDTARVEAVRFAGTYLSDHPELVWDGKEIRVIARDENKQAIMTIIVLSVDCGMRAV